MRVAQFSKKINTEFTLEIFQQYFPIKRHWNERERDTPGRASASETDESSHARTHQHPTILSIVVISARR